MRVAVVLITVLAASAALAAPDSEIVPRTFPIPTRTTWQPEGCRSVPFTHPVVPARTT